MNPEIPMPSYENLSEKELLLLATQGINHLETEIKEVKELLANETKDVSTLKSRIDSCPNCQNNAKVGVGKSWLAGLFILGSGIGAGAVEVVKVLVK